MHLFRGAAMLFGVAGVVTYGGCSLVDPLGDISQPKADGGVPAIDASPWCTAQDADFCEDFDKSTDVESGWSRSILTEGGSLARTYRADAPSPPNVLVASAQLPSGLTDVKALIVKDFDIVPEAVSLEHEFRIVSGPSNVRVKLSALTLVDGPINYELEFVLDVDTMGFKECISYEDGGSDCADHLDAPRPIEGSWMHVRIDFSKGRDGGSGSIRLYIGPNLMLDRAPADAPAFARGKLELAVGIFNTLSVDRIEYAFDNVLLRYR